MHHHVADPEDPVRSVQSGSPIALESGHGAIRAEACAVPSFSWSIEALLTFTYNHGNFIGAYNGRFVFHAPIEGIHSTDEYLRRIAEGHKDALAEQVFRHEYLHWKVFLHSKFGISTVGRRYRARNDFLHGKNMEVVDYYKQRTGYFYCSYLSHESLVQDIEEQLEDDSEGIAKISLSQSQRRKIKESDSASILAAKLLHVRQSRSLSLIDYLRGLQASSEFGLQAYLKQNDGNVRLREVALKSKTFGIFNAAFETELGSKNFIVERLKKIRRSRNREYRSGAFTKTKMAEWAVLKFSTEFESIRRLNENEELNSRFNFEKYARDLSRFVYMHTQIHDAVMMKNLESNILSCADVHPQSDEFKDRVRRFAEFEEAVLYHFYVHGN